MGMVMTSFEKELEAKLKKTIESEFEAETFDPIKDEDKQLEKNEDEIERLEELAAAFEEGKIRIEERIRKLKGYPDKVDQAIYEKDLKELIKHIVQDEILKRREQRGLIQKELSSDQELVLKNEILKRNLKEFGVTTNKYFNPDTKKEQNIKDYQKLLVKNKANDLEFATEDSDISQSERNNRRLKDKKKLLGKYWSQAYSNLLFTSMVIEETVGSFNQADFRELDRALKRLNNNENIKKRKLHPSSEDYYFSFGLSSGIEARIFYRLLPKDFGNRRRVITQIIKQYHTRFVN